MPLLTWPIQYAFPPGSAGALTRSKYAWVTKASAGDSGAVTTGADVGAGLDAAEAEAELITPLTAAAVPAVRSSATAPARIRVISLFLPSYQAAGGVCRSGRHFADRCATGSGVGTCGVQSCIRSVCRFRSPLIPVVNPGDVC